MVTKCPVCHKKTLVVLKYFWLVFCKNIECNFEFRGTWKEFEEIYD